MAATLIEPKAVTLPDAAKMLSISERSVRRLIASKRLRAVRLRRGVRVIVSSIDALLGA